MTPDPLPAPPPAAPPTSNKRTVVMVVGLLVAVPLALCLLIGATAVLFEKTTKKGPLKEGDRVVLITAEDLVAAGASFTPDAKKEKTGRNTMIDGSSDVTYEYESQDPPIYITTTVSLEKSPADAISTYGTQSVGGALGMNLADQKMKLEDRDDLVKWGDQSVSKLLTFDGKPVGNFVVARKGNRVFTAIFTGVYFDEPEAMRSLLEPKLEAMGGLAP